MKEVRTKKKKHMTNDVNGMKKKCGRPALGRTRKLTRGVTVKFSPVSYEALRFRAGKSGRSLAVYIREAALAATVTARHTPEENALLRSLAGMANNLNQLTKLSHQTGFYRTRLLIEGLLEKLFSGCIRYVTQKDDAKIIASEGVLLGTVEETACSFRWQCLLNPDVAKPVGHIALSFKPEDAPRLTDAFMARLAGEYLELMGIRNTQFIVVRHHGTDNPHCHIVFNRVDFDGKVISDSNDFRRNEKVTKMLKDKYSLTYSEGKQSVKTEKLHASEKVKYEIYRAVKEALRSADTWKEFQNKLLKMGVEMEFKYKGNTNEVQGIRFIKNGLSFKGSGIDRSFSWSRLDAALDHNHVTSLENDVSQKQPYHEQSHGSVIDNLVEVTGTGGVFMPSVAPTEDEKEAERLRRKKKRRKGRSL